MEKRKSKAIIRAISVILAVVLFVVGCFSGYLTYRFTCDKSGATSNYDNVYSAEQVRLSTDSEGVFKILKINDTHMFNGTCDDDRKTLDGIKSVLDKTPCDFIVLDGDIVDGFNLKSAYDKFGAFKLMSELIEEYNIPWTFAPGNNDFEIDGSNEDIIAFLMSYDHFVYGNVQDADGSMQFVAEVYNEDTLVHSVAIMDSGARKPKAIGSYQPMTESQAKWLNDEINERGVKASVFFHMPTNTFQQPFDEGEVYDGFDMYNTYPYDEIKGDYVLDDIIKDNQNISLLSCAHQHSNNMCSFYNGRYYQLSSVSGYSAGYGDFITPSCTLTTINTNEDDVRSMYSFEQIAV